MNNRLFFIGSLKFTTILFLIEILFTVFHIHCIKKWSKIARTEDGGWRCPGCQFVRKSPPREYRCFCGKVIDPAYERRETPHSCGEVCGKRLKSSNNEGVCPHKCVELCHNFCKKLRNLLIILLQN